MPLIFIFGFTHRRKKKRNHLMMVFPAVNACIFLNTQFNSLCKEFSTTLHRSTMNMINKLLSLSMIHGNKVRKSRLLSIMPNRPVREKWDYPRKMERHFPIKPRQPIRNSSCHFLSFPNSLIRAKNSRGFSFVCNAG